MAFTSFIRNAGIEVTGWSISALTKLPLSNVYRRALILSTNYGRYRDIKLIDSDQTVSKTRIHVRVNRLTLSSFLYNVSSSDLLELKACDLCDTTFDVLEQLRHIDQSLKAPIGTSLSCLDTILSAIYLDYGDITLLISLKSVPNLSDNMRIATIDPLLYNMILPELKSKQREWMLSRLRLLLSICGPIGIGYFLFRRMSNRLSGTLILPAEHAPLSA